MDDDKIQFSKMGLTVITMGLLADFQVPVLQSAFEGGCVCFTMLRLNLLCDRG